MKLPRNIIRIKIKAFILQIYGLKRITIKKLKVEINAMLYYK